MLKSLKTSLVAVSLVVVMPIAAQAEGDAAAGEKVFKKCKACHAVGETAKHRVGPELNNVIGRTAGTAEGFKYSKAMIKAGEDGVVWNDETLVPYLTKPRDFIKGTKMVFAGLKKDSDRANIIAYLKTFSDGTATESKAAEAKPAAGAETKMAATTGTAVKAADAPVPSHGIFHLGRPATEDEIKAWDIDIRPDGTGLPEGSGSVAQGEEVFAEQCAVCHGDFGEGVDRWPVLSGGQDTLTEERPEKTIGSYWPYLSTVYDYIRRAMPFGNARSLSDDEIYAITAYLLYMNDVVTDEDFVLSKENFTEIRLPNEDNFIPDNRAEEAHYAEKSEPCMKDCKPGPAKVTMRARVLDVTPDGDNEELGAGAVD